LKSKLKNAFSHIFFAVRHKNFSILFGIFSNTFYIISNLVFGMLYSSVASLILSIFYLLFIIVRFMLLVDGDKNARKASRILLFVGAPSSILTGFLSLNYEKKSFSHVFSILFGAYAAASVVLVVFSLLFSKEKNKANFIAAKALRINAALLSSFNFVRLLLLRYLRNDPDYIIICISVFSSFVAFISSFYSYKRTNNKGNI